VAKFAATTTALMEQVVPVIPATMFKVVPATKLKVVAKYLKNMKKNVCLGALASAKAARRMLIVPLTNGSTKHVVIQNAFKEKVAWANTVLITPIVPAVKHAVAANAKKVNVIKLMICHSSLASQLAEEYLPFA